MYIVWNNDKTEGFITLDKQLAYEVRKSADSNCYDKEGNLSEVAVAFCNVWGDKTCKLSVMKNKEDCYELLESLKIILADYEDEVLYNDPDDVAEIYPEIIKARRLISKAEGNS